MKATKIRFLLILFLSLLFFTGIGQNPLRQVNYSTVTSKIFAVPLNTNIEQITHYDLARMMTTDKTEIVEKVVGSDNQLVVTSIYPQTQRHDFDLEFAVGKSVMTAYGLTIYDHDNQVLHSEDFDETIAGFTIDSENLAEFGLIQIFDMDITELAAVFDLMGYNTLINGDGTFSAVNDSSEFYFDPVNYIIETRTFFDAEMIYSDWKKFNRIEGYYIPDVNVMTEYDMLENNIRLQISSITVYDTYSIIDENDEVVVNYVNPNSQGSGSKKSEVSFGQFTEIEKKNAGIKIYPNPASDQLTVELPLFLSSHYTVQVISSTGELVYNRADVESGTDIQLDVSHLTSGIYLLRCGKEEKWKSAKFIKQ